MSVEIIRELAESRGPLALVTVISTEGSVPRHPGSKMIVRPDRSIAGTVGGGRPEAASITESIACMTEKRDSLIALEMHGTEAEGTDLICGGKTALLVEHVADTALYRDAARLLSRGERCVLVKRIVQEGGTARVASALVDEKGGVVAGAGVPFDPGAAERAARSGRPRFVDETGLFYDPLVPPEKLLILGGGHVGKAIASVAAGLGFAVTVADDRPEYLDPRRFPAGVATAAGSFAEIVQRFPWDGATYAVIATRGHLFDLECVRAVLGQTWRYAGLIGSSRKVKMLLDQVRKEGAEPSKVARLCAPIGIDIDAETPEEIAISILAEIVAARRGDGARHPSSMSKAEE